MLRINQLKLPVSHTPDKLQEKLLQNLRIREKELKQYTVRKRSLDARKKPELYYVYTIDFTATDEERLLKRLRGKVQRVKEIPMRRPPTALKKMTNRPVVVGCGPAGLFLRLSPGLRRVPSLIVEQGRPGPGAERRCGALLGTGMPGSGVQRSVRRRRRGYVFRREA